MASHEEPRWASRNSLQQQGIEYTWNIQDYKLDPAKPPLPLRPRLRATSTCSSFSETSIAASSGTDGAYSRPQSILGINDEVWDRRAAADVISKGVGETGDDERTLWDEADQSDEDSGIWKHNEEPHSLYITPSTTFREAVTRFLGLVAFARIFSSSSIPLSSSHPSIISIAFSQLTVSLMIPEILWIIRTAHRTRTAVILHVAWKLYMALHCTLLSATLVVLALGWVLASCLMTSKKPAIPSPLLRSSTDTTLNRGCSDHQWTNPTSESLVHDTPFLRTFIIQFILFMEAIAPIARLLLSFLILVLSAVFFCTICALYPHIQNPFALSCIFCACTAIGLRLVDTFDSEARLDDLDGTSLDERIGQPETQVDPSLSPTGVGVLHPTLFENEVGHMAQSLSHSAGQEHRGIGTYLLHLVLSSLVVTLLTTAWCAWLIMMGDLDPERILLLSIEIFLWWRR
ncbi:hypothetical protein FRC17_004538 [Serendipita sp. 399]|nr:hypothetical protein FRC17_004538 [Serendipita sp. 399]